MTKGNHEDTKKKTTINAETAEHAETVERGNGEMTIGFSLRIDQRVALRPVTYNFREDLSE